MDYTRDIYFYSNSGYAMPFKEDDKPVEVLLGFGKQKHPRTGEEFLHNGWDIKAPDYMLLALGTGIVAGVMTDEDKKMTLTIRYGEYDVIYRHLKHVIVGVGDNVVAGTKVGVSHRFFHLGVKHNGEYLNPEDLLSVIYANYLTYMQVENGNTEVPVNGMNVNTPYDEKHEELEMLMEKYLPQMFGEILKGRYAVPKAKEEQLRGIFHRAASDNIYGEQPRTVVNPGGLGMRGLSIIEEFQFFFITFFLGFISQRFGIFLSGTDEETKKKLMTSEL